MIYVTELTALSSLGINQNHNHGKKSYLLIFFITL